MDCLSGIQAVDFRIEVWVLGSSRHVSLRKQIAGQSYSLVAVWSSFGGRRSPKQFALDRGR